MNKLEDIRLQLGDKITFDDGFETFIDSDEANEHNKPDNWISKKHIIKIERLIEYKGNFDGIAEDYSRITSGASNFFKWGTIWEREEETTNDDIEELKRENNILHLKSCDLGSLTKADIILIDKLNEVIRKINKIDRGE